VNKPRWWQRLEAWVWMTRHRGRSLNRRAVVEIEMWDIINGRREMATVEELRVWAVHLGVPDDYQIDPRPLKQKIAELNNDA
jgi:hypothetical protein